MISFDYSVSTFLNWISYFLCNIDYHVQTVTWKSLTRFILFFLLLIHYKGKKKLDILTFWQCFKIRRFISFEVWFNVRSCIDMLTLKLLTASITYFLLLIHLKKVRSYWHLNLSWGNHLLTQIIRIHGRSWSLNLKKKIPLSLAFLVKSKSFSRNSRFSTARKCGSLHISTPDWNQFPANFRISIPAFRFFVFVFFFQFILTIRPEKCIQTSESNLFKKKYNN